MGTYAIQLSSVTKTAYSCEYFRICLFNNIFWIPKKHSLIEMDSEYPQHKVRKKERY